MKSFLLKPSGKDYIWGGTRLKSEFGKDFLPQDPLAETWECSVHPDGPSRVASGPWTGRTLAELLAACPEYLGTSPSVSGGQGLPVLMPKGARVVQLLQRWVEDTEQIKGYLLTKTPLMA